jgi:hypothetical protein
MKNDLQNELTSTKQDLLNVLNLFDQENINVIPFENSWTGGQVAEHVLKSLSGCLRNITGPTKLTERNPEEHVKQLGEIFLNLGIKMKSPDFIIPSNEPKNKSFLIKSLGESLEGIKIVAGTEDLSATCTGFEMPMLGALTRVEWISFSLFHTQRHIQQLKNIANHLKTQTA